MNEEGWYPDPGGAPDCYRYWDGTSWSQETGSDPASPPPTGREAPVAERRGRWVVALVAAIVLVTGLAVVLPGVLRDRTAGTSGGAQPTVAGPSDSPTPYPCPLGAPDLRSSPPSEELRVYGGNLSFPRAPELGAPEPEVRLSFAADVSQQAAVVHEDPDWIAQLAVGRLRAEDNFPSDVQDVADEVLRCALRSSLYQPYAPKLRNVHSQLVQLTGQPGCTVQAQIGVEVAGLPFPGDDVTITVVPDGRDWGFYFSAAPAGNARWAEIARRAAAGLAAS